MFKMEKHFLYLLFPSILILSAHAKSVIDSTYSLPKNMKPIRYNLTMEPNLNLNLTNITSSFSGSVVIELKTLENTKNITLHARRLNITESSIKVINTNGLETKCVNTSYDEDRQFFIIDLEEELVQSEYYILTIGEFLGDLRYDNVGFYLANYEDSKKQDRYIATSDFEPSDARKAFPCFDEPSQKATFIISIIRPEGYNSLSNEELLTTENLGDGRYKDTFKETVVMPIYVVAFIVSDFKHTAAKNERHRVFARPEAIDSGKLDYALVTSVETLHVLEEFTGINYTHSKMDLIAIPDQYFSDEAMENWGLVTFSENHLFISNETSTTEDIQRCTTYIAHEFAHQWFGNLVTFKNWKYIWLSEGFGAYFQYYIASLVKPSWRLMDQFVIHTLHHVLEFDASKDTQPMNYQPKHIGTIPSPWICYYKASSVIRMIEHFLTNDIFRKGLHIYLEKNKFGVTEPSDLYQAFQEAINQEQAHKLLGNNTVSSILQTWDSNAGYPLVNVTRNYDTGSVTLTQRRYMDDHEVNSTSIWYIPISYAFESDIEQNFSDTSANLWLTENNITINDNFSADGWLLINKQQTGFYRVNYDITNWNRLAEYLSTENFKSIHVANRAQLIHDSFHFAQLGQIPYEVPLNLSKYLIQEKDYIPIAAFLKALENINLMMSSSTVYDIFKNYVINLLSVAYDHLGFDEKSDDTHLDKRNRIGILRWLCTFGHSECRNTALQRLRKWKENDKFLFTANLELSALCGAMRNAPIEDWEFLYRKFETASKEKKTKILKALTCSENPTILNELLNRISNTTTLLSYEGRVSIRTMANAGNMGLKVALEYVTQHDDIPERGLPMFAYYIGERMTSQQQIDQMATLNRTSTNGEFSYGIKLAQENLDWINKGYAKQIEDWLRDYNLNHIESSNII